MIPVQGAIEAYLVIFNSLPQPIFAFLTLSLFLSVVSGLIGLILKL